MGAISAVRQAVGAVARNPILIAAALLFGVIQAPQLLAQSVNSAAVVLAAGVLSLVFLLLYPFFFGGIIGMGDEAIEGTTRLGTFLSAGRANYVSLFGAFLILIGVFVLYFIALLIVGAVGGVAVVSLGGGAAGGAASLAIVGIVLVAFLLYFVVFFFIQLFGQAIVLDDVGAVGGFKRSISAVRGHKLSTLGYTLIISLIGLVFGAFGALFTLFQSPAAGSGLQSPPLGVVVVVLAVFVVLTGIVGAFSMTYGVAFYKEIRPAVE